MGARSMGRQAGSHNLRRMADTLQAEQSEHVASPVLNLPYKYSNAIKSASLRQL